MANNIPKHWGSVRFKEIIGYVIGGDWGLDYTEKHSDEYSPVYIIRGTELKKWKYGKGQTAVKRLVAVDSIVKRMLIPGDIIIEISGGGPDQPVGRTVVIDRNIIESFKKPIICTNFFRLIRTPSSVDSKFINYQLNYNYEKGIFDQYQTNTTNLRNLTFGRLTEELTILLPPLKEQKRISSSLDNLFKNINSIQSQLDHFQIFIDALRLQILYQAVTGELTKDWRRKNRINKSTWKKTTLGQVADLRLGKMLDKYKNEGISTPYLRNINVRWFSFNLDDLNELKISKKEKEKLNIKNGDLLVCEGGEPGRCAVWNNGKQNITFQKAIHRVRPIKDVQPLWIAYNIKTDADNGNLAEYFTGTTIKHFTGQSLFRYELEIPLRVEQDEILKRVKILFNQIEKVEKLFNKLNAIIKLLPQQVLSKGFSGKLVPQNSKDESVEKLLEKIREEKAKMIEDRSSSKRKQVIN